MQQAELTVSRFSPHKFPDEGAGGKIYPTYTVISLIALLFAAPWRKNLSTQYRDEMDNYKLTQLRCRPRMMFCHDASSVRRRHLSLFTATDSTGKDCRRTGVLLLIRPRQRVYTHLMHDLWRGILRRRHIPPIGDA